jgi:hypothetical protein
MRKWKREISKGGEIGRERKRKENLKGEMRKEERNGRKHSLGRR